MAQEYRQKEKKIASVVNSRKISRGWLQRNSIRVDSFKSPLLNNNMSSVLAAAAATADLSYRSAQMKSNFASKQEIIWEKKYFFTIPRTFTFITPIP